MKQRDLGRSSAAAADRYVTALRVGSAGRCARYPTRDERRSQIIIEFEQLQAGENIERVE